MKLPSTKPRNVAFILIALCLCACRSRQKVSQVQSLNKIEATQIVESTIFHTFDLVIVDSTVEYSGTDTTTRVRFVRATKAESSTYEATETQTQTDTASEVREEIAVTPIAVQSIKNGLAASRVDPKLPIGLFFIIFFCIIVVICKKYLFLRR